MTYLLDVNALLALAHSAHVHHVRVEDWVATLSPSDRLATCSITELGFARIAPQARLSRDVSGAKAVLNQLMAARRPAFTRVADALGADALPAWVTKPAQTTDGHLVALAAASSATLATLDAGIPSAFLIP